jgi:anthranilate phosphoribosyltransferase
MSESVLDEATARAREGKDLTREQAAGALSVIMGGHAREDQIRDLLLALRDKGETAEELAGMAETMRSMASEVRPKRAHLLDTCGTGGGRQTFNISTAAALVADEPDSEPGLVEEVTEMQQRIFLPTVMR